MDILRDSLLSIFHSIIMFLGGILVISQLKTPKTVMLINRIIIIVFCTYKLNKIFNG